MLRDDQQPSPINAPDPRPSRRPATLKDKQDQCGKSYLREGFSDVFFEARRLQPIQRLKVEVL
jgi:hypothetical protein